MHLENKIADLGSRITVKIAEREVSLSEFRDYSTDSTIEFNKYIGDEVDLILHNKAYGKALLEVKDNIIYLKILEIY